MYSLEGWMIIVAADHNEKSTHTHTYTKTHTSTICRNPLDEGSACRRDLYLTTKILTTDRLPFEPAVPASDRPQSHALDRAVTGFDSFDDLHKHFRFLFIKSSLKFILFTVCIYMCSQGGKKNSISYFTFSVVTIPVPEQIIRRNK